MGCGANNSGPCKKLFAFLGNNGDGKSHFTESGGFHCSSIGALSDCNCFIHVLCFATLWLVFDLSECDGRDAVCLESVMRCPRLEITHQ
jgi:hypothetical protein